MNTFKTGLLFSAVLSANAMALTAEFTPITGITGNAYDKEPRAVSNDGKVVFRKDVWSKENGVELEALHELEDISSDGRKVLAHNGFYTDGIFEPLSEELQWFSPVAMSDNGRIAVGQGGASFNLWDANTGYELLENYGFRDISPDGTYALASNGILGAVLYNLETKTLSTIPDTPFPLVFEKVLSNGDILTWGKIIKANGVTVTINPLGPDTGAMALDITDNGKIAVGRANTNDENPELRASNEEAIIWDDENGTRSLEEVLQEKYNVDLQGWILTRALEISADGYYITGVGINPEGNLAPWLITLTDECTLSAF